ncbi:Conserved_hypothetical protein [Hexamita inflata]|uniref:Uncharacterized protein n=1 Tax=Hexamita inflata TaxID=28002 RepID=A0AA86RQ15_9EUKA|nr:Conserved hypothetical protein [Hexamita inflata]CAI9970520.1 Conserved hypothetical protein [Hexamita inflata]
MPISQKNQQQIIDTIAQIASSQYKIDKQELLEDFSKLSIAVSKKFAWDIAAKQLGLQKHELYRWFHDTWERNRLGSVEKVDVQIIKQEIQKALQNQIQLDKTFQQKLKQQLTKEYHRNSFTVAFNNQKRIILASLEKKSSKQGTPKQQITNNASTELNGVQEANSIVDILKQLIK